jgi:uncharacterized protein (DUF488 family)
MPPGAIFTIGHSTREADDFVALLSHHGVDLLVDVRRHPGSRRHPHFNREALAERLATDGIEYRHAPDLGGRRVGPSANEPADSPRRDDSSGHGRSPGRDDSPNRGWRNASFRAYADYMATPPFRAALDQLLDDAGNHTVAVMCAEAVPWRCHRNLISDALVARDVEVRHILSDDAPSRHEVNPMARLSPQGTLTYPAEQAVERRGRRGGARRTGGGGGGAGGGTRGESGTGGGGLGGGSAGDGEDGSQGELFD